MKELTYRKATIKDLERISYLMTMLHTDTGYENLLAENKYFINKGAFFVALDNSCEKQDEMEIVGYVFGLIRTDYVEESEQYRDPKVGYIESLFVLPEYRHRGVARELCKRLEEWAKEKGALEMGSDAYMANAESRAFHKAIGFRESEPIIHFIKRIGDI